MSQSNHNNAIRVRANNNNIGSSNNRTNVIRVQASESRSIVATDSAAAGTRRRTASATTTATTTSITTTATKDYGPRRVRTNTTTASEGTTTTRTATKATTSSSNSTPIATTIAKKTKKHRTQELIEQDKVELCQWITTSKAGDNKDFKKGKERRFALHQLCRKLIEMNQGLSLLDHSYGASCSRILNVNIESMPSSALILPPIGPTTETSATTTTTTLPPHPPTTTTTTTTIEAVKEKQERWEKSTAKEVLSTLLRDPMSWVNQIINSDPTFGVLRSRSTNKTIEKIHGNNALLKEYPLKNFLTNFRSLKNAIEREVISVEFDQKAYNKEILKYPMQRILKTGYPRWNHPDNRAKQLLEEDTKPGGIYNNENLKPKDLKVTRPEYQAFPDKIFRDRLYKAKSAHIEKPYWQNERNKTMRKKKVAEENLLQTEWM